MIITYTDAFIYLGLEFLRMTQEEKSADVQDVVNRASAGTLFMWLEKHHDLVIDGLSEAVRRNLCKFFTDAVPDSKLTNGFAALIYACLEGISLFGDRCCIEDLY